MMPLKITRYVLAWPRFLGWLFPLLAIALFCARDLRLEDDAVLAATWRPWFAARWKFSTTIAASTVYHPNHLADSSIRSHERVHVRQAEDLAIAGLVLALIVMIVELEPGWFFLWPFAMLLQTAGFLGAVLRGGHVYRDAEHERSAYAQTDVQVRPHGASWLEEHESRPRGW